MGYPTLRVLQHAPASVDLTGVSEDRGSGNVDRFGRRIDYLRISITDRCNLRCVYCMPAEGVTLAPRESLLRVEEIWRVARAARELGFNKFRITGGEPLLVRSVLEVLRGLREATAGATLALTTNGVRLTEFATALRDVGVDRLNISIDTLQRERFLTLTRRDELHAVLAGIEAALQAGFTRVKLNCVIVRGHNDDELCDLAALAQRWPVDVRFIEQMPLGVDGGDNRSECTDGPAAFLGAAAMEERLRAVYALCPIPADDPRDAAQINFTAPNLQGRLAIIAPRSRKFCSQCNRLRLTPHGELKGCLLSEGTLDIRQPLRAGIDDTQLRNLLCQAIALKPYEYRDERYGLDRPMSAMGG